VNRGDVHLDRVWWCGKSCPGFEKIRFEKIRSEKIWL